MTVAHAGGLFNHHHGIGSVRQRGARCDLGAFALGNRVSGRLAGEDLFDDVKLDRRFAGGAVCVVGDDRVPVHR